MEMNVTWRDNTVFFLMLCEVAKSPDENHLSRLKSPLPIEIIREHFITDKKKINDKKLLFLSIL